MTVKVAPPPGVSESRSRPLCILQVEKKGAMFRYG